VFELARRHINTSSDSEVLLNIFASELDKFPTYPLTADNIFSAVHQVHKIIKGAYACVAMIIGHGLVAFRDPFGIRPLVIGKKVIDEQKTEYMVASESVALDILDFEFMRDVEPGEAIYITQDGQLYSKQCSDNPQYYPCIFEYVYFARPDSFMNGVSVYQSRILMGHSKQCSDNPQFYPCIFEYVYFARPDSFMNGVSVYQSRILMGQKLGQKIAREWRDIDIDVVIPIPETSCDAALEIARILDKPYRQGFVKNRYVGRTFIMPGQNARKLSVRRKLNANRIEFEGKNVLLVDDSIVRGTTSEKILEMVRSVGAKKVYLASAAPEIRHPNVYGIDMPVASELIAYNRSVDEIAKEIGADRLIFQDLSDLIDSIREQNPNIHHLECSVFNGKYITEGVDDNYFNQLENNRAETKIPLSIKESENLEIYNEEQ
jgi:Glutamine phosphoribosylpyrophosphate amidotransferase